MLERLVGTGALLAVFAAVAGGASASSSALPRATTDRPDDVLGPQVHFVYAVPADGGDRHLDDSGTIEGSVELFQRWLRGETGGRGLRIDRYQGSLDVSFARLRTTDAELAARSGRVFRATLKLDERLFRVDCAARAGRTKLRASRVVRGALGECRWRLPRNKRGKLLRGSITAIADSGLVTKTFSLRIT